MTCLFWRKCTDQPLFTTSISSHKYQQEYLTKVLQLEDIRSAASTFTRQIRSGKDSKHVITFLKLHDERKRQDLSLLAIVVRRPSDQIIKIPYQKWHSTRKLFFPCHGTLRFVKLSSAKISKMCLPRPRSWIRPWFKEIAFKC